MANSVSLKLTNHGLNKVMSEGAQKSFAYFSLSDMNELYNVSVSPNLEDIMNITGSKNLFTARKSCIDSIPTTAQVLPPTEEVLINNEQRWLVNFYKTNCGVWDYEKSNLDITINLHEYFSWLEGLVASGYTETLDTSLVLIDGINLVKQEQNFVDKTWENIDGTSLIAPSYEFVTEEDKKNYLKLNSKYVEFNGIQRVETDKSFDRFYTSLLFGFGSMLIGGYYLEGHNSYLTFQAPQFGYVINGTTNYISLDKLGNPNSYDEIRPAVILGSLADDLYYLKEPKKYNTTDFNGFMGQAIWGYVNNKGQSLIKGMINKAKSHIQFYFKETSFNKWELPLNLRMRLDNTSDLKIVGGNIKYNFVYDPNATISGYNNILIIK